MPAKREAVKIIFNREYDMYEGTERLLREMDTSKAFVSKVEPAENQASLGTQLAGSGFAAIGFPTSLTQIRRMS